MKILFIEIPTGERTGGLPFGILYAAGAVLRCKHEAKILDYNTKKFSFPSLIKTVNEYKPDLIGIGGITASYRNLKRCVSFLKSNCPNIPIIIGGVISCIDELLLKQAKVDIVVHCEAEVVMPFIIQYYHGEIPVDKIPGISYLRDGIIFKTEVCPQVKSMDDIPFPPYELLKINKYFYSPKQWIDYYLQYHPYDKLEVIAMIDRLKKTPYMSQIISSRGCMHSCSFCYRHMRGVRQHSVNYLIEHIKYLRNKYGVGLFSFCDELTIVNKKWAFDFCDSLEKERLDINFIIIGTRADTLDDVVLKRLKEAGCITINCGYESGSDAILKEMKKGITREENIRTALAIKKAGIGSTPDVMIGFPGETGNTINETIEFLKIIDTYPIVVNYVLPFPETPLWQYCLDKRLITDIEEFILNYKVPYFLQVNLTKFPDKIVRSWMPKIMQTITRHHLVKNKDYASLAKLELHKKTFSVGV